MKMLRIRCANGEPKSFGPFEKLTDLHLEIIDGEGALRLTFQGHVHVFAPGYWLHAWTEDAP